MKEQSEIEYRTEDGGFRYRQRIGEDGIVYGISVGKQGVDDSRAVIAAYEQAYRTLGRTYRHALDVSELQSVDAEARKLMSDFVLSDDSVVSRMAVHGGSFFMRTFFNVYCRIARIPMRVFDTRDDAVAWLEEE